MAKNMQFAKARAFLGRLQATVQALPTDAEKREALEKIAALGDFLNALNASIEAMPTMESVGNISESMERLQELFAKVEANPVLAGLKPAPRPLKPRKDRVPVTEVERAAAKPDVELLRSLPAEEIRARLLDERIYSLARLRAIASALGIGTTEKLGRDSLAHQVTTKIANFRGYERLSGEGESEGPSHGVKCLQPDLTDTANPKG